MAVDDSRGACGTYNVKCLVENTIVLHVETAGVRKCI